MTRWQRTGCWLAATSLMAAGVAASAQTTQSPPIEYYRLVPGFVAERVNADGMALGNGFDAPNPWGAYTAYLLATNTKGQRTWRIENYLPNSASGTAQGSSMYLFEGRSLALLVDTAQNTPDEPGRTDLKTVVRHLLGHENDGTTTRPSPVDFVVSNTHSHGDHTGKNTAMSDRTVYYPERDWPAKGAPPNYVPIKEGGGASPHGNGQAVGDIDLGDRTIVAIDLHEHTPGSTGYLDRENRMIATGDAIGSAYVWAHFGAMTHYLHTVRHLQNALRPFPHADVLPAHFYQIRQGARGRPPINGRPLDKTYVDDQVRTAEGILDGTVISEPYRIVGRHAVMATVDSAQIVWTMGNVSSEAWPFEPGHANAWRVVTLPGALPASVEGDRFAGLRNVRSGLFLIRGPAASDTVYLVVGSTRALLIGTGDGTPNLRALVAPLAGNVPVDVVVTGNAPGQTGGLTQFAGDVLHLPEGVTPPAGAATVRRIGAGSRIDLGTDRDGRPLVLEVHPMTGRAPSDITLLSANDRILFSGDALGEQRADGGLLLRQPVAAFADALSAWRKATNGRYDVVYTARNFQWFTAAAYVDELQASVANAASGDAAAWTTSPARTGLRIARSQGAADVVASIAVEAP